MIQSETDISVGRISMLPDVILEPSIGVAPAEEHITAASALVATLFGGTPPEIRPVVNGYWNQVFIADTHMGIVVVRTGSSSSTYQKSGWAIDLARGAQVPVAKIVARGEYNYLPHEISSYIEGMPANHYRGDRLPVWFRLGEYAKKINNIPTNGFGKEFDTSANQPKHHEDWRSFIEAEYEPHLDPASRERWQVLDDSSRDKLIEIVKNLKSNPGKTGLVHGDLAFKNIRVNGDGDIVAILDWDWAYSHMVPEFEFARLFDANEEELSEFVKGYGLTQEEYDSLLPTIKGLRALDLLVHLSFLIEVGSTDEARELELKIKDTLEG